WNEYRRTDLEEYQAIMDRNEVVFYEQYEAHTRAQEEAQRAAASASTPAGHGEQMFTYGELGLDDSPGFRNFMDP
ncbi:hypothetical protein A2U01_0102868, partial [Trifolium medium]|nr:hypothetical protein [Trifolium medium]